MKDKILRRIRRFGGKRLAAAVVAVSLAALGVNIPPEVISIVMEAGSLAHDSQ